MIAKNFFNTAFVIPILNILLLFYAGFLFLKIPWPLGWAIVLLTCFVRLILHPFNKKQLETTKKMNDLKPHLDRLADTHKNDKQKLQQEQLKLYQEAGINPASGCLFVIVQIPIFIALFNTLNLFLANGNSAKVITEINNVVYWSFLQIKEINPWFLGLNLALSPQKAKIWYYLLVPVVTAALQFLQAHHTIPSSPKKEEKESNQTADFQKAMNTQMKYVLPIMIGYFAYTLPVGLSLYWNIFSIFSIIQYKKIHKS